VAQSKGCACSGGVRLLFPCSGAADTGEISDRAARRLARGGFGRMFCLAGIGGRVPFIMDNMKMAADIWAIDGCPEDCARHTLERAGFTVTRHLRVTDCGLEKGKSPASEENIDTVVAKAQAQSAC
jgi:uncharacterized metal-binding protein